MRPDDERPLSGLAFAVAGAGRVGASLARWAVAGGARLARVAVHRRRDRAEELVGDCAAAGNGAEIVPFDALASGDLDLLLVAVSDPALDAVAARLAEMPQAAVVLHTAGARGASALAPVAANGSAAGTLHPLKAFPHVLADPAEARGVTFAVDGDEAACRLAERLARTWGGVPQRVPEAQRDLYHLAATLAAGGVVTMLTAAERVAGTAGLDPHVLGGYLELARGAVAGAGEALADQGSFASAITGPAARGDGDTVMRQLAALEAVSPALADLAAGVARQALAAIATAGRASDSHRQLLARLEARERASAGRPG